jgi:hypothetical protein
MVVQPAYVRDLFDPAAWLPLVALAAAWVGLSALGVAAGLGVARSLGRLWRPPVSPARSPPGP